MTMKTRKEAKEVVSKLQGWDAPRIEREVAFGVVNYYVTAVNPESHRRLVYNERTKFFD